MFPTSYHDRTIFLLTVAAVNILFTLQVLLKIAPNDRENPIENTEVFTC